MGSTGEKFELHLISTYLLELFVTDYLREITINFYLSLMYPCTLAALKDIEKEMVEVFKYDSDRRKKAVKQKIGMIKFLTSTLYFLARLTLALSFTFCYLLAVFKKLIFRKKI